MDHALYWIMCAGNPRGNTAAESHRVEQIEIVTMKSTGCKPARRLQPGGAAWLTAADRPARQAHDRYDKFASFLKDS
jgi:hypothetical protein